MSVEGAIEVSIKDGPLGAARLPPEPAADAAETGARQGEKHKEKRPKRKRGLEGVTSVDCAPIHQVGAVVVFEGIVRGEEDGQRIAALNYTAYDPMATMELTKLARDVLEKHGLKRVVVEHSRGRVCVGEVSFRLTIWSAHRKESLAAMDEFIDRMKEDVPIWKSAER